MKIKISSASLLSALRSNRNKHEKEFNEAISKYRVKLGETLMQMHRDNEKGISISQHISLTKPVHHLGDYDRAIKMVDMQCSGDGVELEEEDFRRYVQDEWEWSTMFKGTTSMYNGG